MNLNLLKKMSVAVLMSGAMVVPGVLNAQAAKNDEKTDTASKEEAKKITPGSDSTVVGEVDGIKVTLGEVKELAKELPKSIQTNFDVVYPIILNQVLYKKALTSMAKGAGLDKDKETLKKVKECEEMMLQKVFLDREVDKIATPDLLRQKYNEFLKQMPREMKASMSFMLLKTQDAAKKVISRLQKGEAFAKLAVSESAEETKDGPITTDFTKGSLRQLVEDEKDFVETIFKSKGATNIAVPAKIKGKDLWAVFRVESIEAVEPPKFDDVKDEVKEAMRPQLAQEVLKKLVAKAKFKRFEQDGKTSMKEPEAGDSEAANTPEVAAAPSTAPAAPTLKPAA